MTILHNLEPVGEVAADDRSRISFGKIGVRGFDRFAVARAADGTLVLTPLASIPKRELIVWENKELRESLARGMGDVEAGRVEPAGSFAEHLNNDADD